MKKNLKSRKAGRKLIYALVAILISICSNTQAQLHRWVIAPAQVEMATNPLVSDILEYPNQANALAPTVDKVGNSKYDSNNDLLFYVSDNKVYDKYSSQIGNSLAVSNAEISIVPFGDNGPCQKKFSIFTMLTIGNQLSILKYELDMLNYTLSTAMLIDQFTILNEFGAIAISKTFNTNGDRYIYAICGTGTLNAQSGQIRRITIDNHGNTLSAMLLFTPPIQAAVRCMTAELDLSPDGNYLLWASYLNSPGIQRYSLLDITNPNTPIYHPFDIPNIGGNNANGFRGVEFSQNLAGTKLFVGAGADGVYETDLTQSYYNKVFQSNDYGFSQIEFAENGLMYVASNNSVNIGLVNAFDPFAFMPAMLGGTKKFTLIKNLTPFACPNFTTFLGNTPFRTLPDQIDGEDYSLNLSAPNPQTASTDVYIHNAALPVIWTYNSSNNPWAVSSGAVQVISELRITGNSHLTIDNMKFQFSPNAKVIIEQGSTLTLDNGAIFTSDKLIAGACEVNDGWQGVEVWGTSTFSQIAPNAQGKLEIKNNSIIEYAKWGARNWNPSTGNFSQTGGIIIGNTGATFRDNAIDVEFKEYHNVINNLTLSNLSYFSHTNFITTSQNYSFTTPPVHASLYGIDGLRFDACTFTNNQAGNANAPMAGIGILAYDASFYVVPYCAITLPNGTPCPPGYFTKTTFSNLYRGIQASTISKNHPFHVSNTDFINNAIGILGRGVNNAVILNNNIEVCNTNAFVSDHYGIDMRGCSGFAIEENNIYATSNNATSHGVQIFNSGAADNVVYLNSFSNLNIANDAYGVNRDNVLPFIHGLQYICNSNILNSIYDFNVFSNGINPFGVCLNQGTTSFPAGNSFSYFGAPAIDFNNNTTLKLNYHCTAADAPAATFNVAIVTNTGENECLPHGNIAKISNSEMENLVQEYDSLEMAFQNLSYVYSQTMDGGNRAVLLSNIQTGWQANAMQMHTGLMALSPYVSQEVLYEAATSNILPPAMLFAICMANPDATRDMEFVNTLQNGIANPLPQYMIWLIMASWNQSTLRTVMESTMAHFSSDMAITSNAIISNLYYKAYIVNSTGSTNYNCDDTVNYWLTRIQTLAAKYDLIENYFANNNITAAQNLLTSMQTNFTMSADQQITYNKYVAYFNLRKALIQGGHNYYELTTTQIDAMTNLASTDDDYAAILAQNFLCYYYNICFENATQTVGNRSGLGSFSNQGNLNSTLVKVAPNPAKEFTIITYTVYDASSENVLFINDISGRVVKQYKLQQQQGEIIWQTTDVLPGLYFYTLKCGNKFIASGKISVEK